MRKSLFPVTSDKELLHKPTKQKAMFSSWDRYGLIDPALADHWRAEHSKVDPPKKKNLGRNLVIFLENLTVTTQPSFPNSPSLSCQQQKPKPHRNTSPEARLNKSKSHFPLRASHKQSLIPNSSLHFKFPECYYHIRDCILRTNSLTARSSCRGFSACHTNALHVFCSADNCGLSCVFEKFHPTK